ncbi:serine/threonine-protein kinase [Microbispora catharanthi]|uniref:non-specific serine/threonine protein kinase n=1 Tax=Microbispora catharanthi TaxID=1712871 RepID=A0A5N6BYC2_9ACTN|nr:serine/threonine-protein kinase [Microbispora catharanthi]KAB8185495.1 protein kinase [Microbispora catharanthi]
MSRAEGRLVGGRYQLMEPIGRGGMGVVWRAHDQLLDRAVAVKEVRYDSAMGDELSDLNRRTMREARAAGRLTHPNVVVVHDVIEEDDRPWIIMQLVPSRSLGQVIREDGPLSPERTVEIGLQILDALRAAHRQGVLHRDVKPENVLLTEDARVVLTDFGIARLEADSTMTRTGLVGTPAFIAPERLRGEAAQRESDLWSLGATLYTAVEGKPPHDRGMAMATMHAVLNDDPAPPRRAGALGPVLLRMLAKEPADRPGYDELTRLLKRASRELSPPPSRPAEPASPRPATPEAAKPETPASRQGKASRGAAPYPPVSSPPVSSARRDERPAEGDEAAGAGHAPAPDKGAAAGRGGAGAASEAAGPGEITSPLPVIRDEGAPEQGDGPHQEKAGKAPATMPETGAQAAPPARTKPSTGAPAKEKPGGQAGPAAEASADDGTVKVGPAVTSGAASGAEDRKAPEGSAASGKTTGSGTSSGERPPTTPESSASQSSASRPSTASGGSATPKGTAGGTTGSGTGAAGGSDSRTDRAGDRAGAAARATADRTQDGSGAAGIAGAGSPMAGLRQAPATVPSQGGAAWHEASTSAVSPRSSNGMLKVALVLIPALLVIAGVAGYLGLMAGEGDSAGDPAAGSDAAPAATGKTTDKPSSAAPSSAAPSASASDEATSPSPEPSPSPKTSEPADVPKGWHKYKHSSGFSLALPKGWHVDGRGNGEVRFRGDSHTYLEVHHTTSPESDALKVWRRDVPGMSRNFPGYKLIEIREVKGYWKTAADWEFTFGDSRYRSRVIDRGFVTDKHNGYALLYKTQDKDWKKKKDLFETIASTFKPAK